MVAVFVELAWTDQARLRLWAKQQNADTAFVLLTDEPSDGNTVLARQLRCSGVVAAIVRIPGVMRSVAELERARCLRDLSMLEVSDSIVMFGSGMLIDTKYSQRAVLYGK